MSFNVSAQRHKTAMRRAELSRPIRFALETGVLNSETSFFDYGCGHGDDVERLINIGVAASGWDPVYEPTSERRPADVVNLGYVVNVIENPTERAAVLRAAWSLAKKVLVVSARLTIEARDGILYNPYSDGHVTTRGTFQKFYDQRELGAWIDQVLDVQSIAVAPGIFYVFRNSDLRESLAASRYRRNINAPTENISHLLFDQNRELLIPLIDFITNRGRLPDSSELDNAIAIRERFGSLKRAFAIIRKVTSAEQWDRIRDTRADDLLVYLALSKFHGRPKISSLPSELQLDIRAFFGNYRRAIDSADKLLFTAGNRDVVRSACEHSNVGKRLPDALYVHTSALPALPSVLRVYEGCARTYIGSVEGANVVKLSIGKPQISYLYYPDFDRQGHPALAASLLVPLDDFHINYRDYTESKNPFILHRKEALVTADHPYRSRFERLTKKEEKFGLYEKPELIGTKAGWEELLKSRGLSQSGHQITKIRTQLAQSRLALRVQ